MYFKLMDGMIESFLSWQLWSMVCNNVLWNVFQEWPRAFTVMPQPTTCKCAVWSNEALVLSSETHESIHIDVPNASPLAVNALHLVQNFHGLWGHKNIGNDAQPPLHKCYSPKKKVFYEWDSEYSFLWLFELSFALWKSNVLWWS